MATRKKPETKFKPDSSSSSSKDLSDYMLPEKDVARLVKLSQEASVDVVRQLALVANDTVERLGVSLKGARPLTAKPELLEEASVQIDVRSFFNWMERIPKGAKKAKAQLAGLVVLLKGRVG